MGAGPVKRTDAVAAFWAFLALVFCAAVGAALTLLMLPRLLW
jgi:hypothetical protein